MSEQESPKNNDLVKDISKTLKEEWKKDELGQKIRGWKNSILTLISNLKQAKNIVKNNFEMGRKQYDMGNFDDAVFRFKFLTWMEPMHADGWYWLAASYMATGKTPNAKIAARKALAIKPDFQEAKDLLKAASGAP